MRAATAVLLAFGLMAAAPTSPATAASTSIELERAAALPTEFSAQQRRRPRVRIYRENYDRGVYPSYFPGSNAVRDCSVTYVREFRPSGPVITPNMRCIWRQP